MRKLMAHSMLALCVVAQVGGCARNYTVYHGAWEGAVAPSASAADLPPIEARAIEIDVSQVPASSQLATAAKSADDEPYLALSARQCQCMAAANATLANLGSTDMQLAGFARARHKAAARIAAVKSDFLALRALDERNRAAGQALEMYYQLFEAEAAKDAVDRSLARLDDVIDSAESLRAKGLKVEVDLDELRTQKIELLDKRAEAQLALARLNSGLRSLLGVPTERPRRFWPTENLTVSPERLDIDAAVAQGLSTRADLALLRMLTSTLSDETLPVVQSALQQAGLPGQGGGGRLWAPLARLLGGARQSLELATRSQQLAQLASDGEQAAAEEIRSAAQTVETRLLQVALAKEKHDSQQRRLETLTKKRDLGTATPVDVVMQRVAVIEAEHELVRRVVAWEIAVVKLKQAQGLLVVECGGASAVGWGASGAGFCDTCHPVFEPAAEFEAEEIETGPSRQNAQ